MWPVLTKFQHSNLLLVLDLSLPFRLTTAPIRTLLATPAPVRIEFDDVHSLKSILRTSLARIQSLTSLNFNFLLLIELLTATLISFQLFSTDAKN